MDDINKIPVEINKKIVGYILKDFGVYQTFRTEKHFFIRFRGFGISKDILTQLENFDIRKIIIIYEGKSRIIYTSELTQWIKSDLSYNFEGDEQKFVCVDDMTKHQEE